MDICNRKFNVTCAGGIDTKEALRLGFRPHGTIVACLPNYLQEEEARVYV
jgi:hypothetical protein